MTSMPTALKALGKVIGSLILSTMVAGGRLAFLEAMLRLWTRCTAHSQRNFVSRLIQARDCQCAGSILYLTSAWQAYTGQFFAQMP